MPRVPRNPGSGKPPHNGPATGPGWGGPAKGAGTGGPPTARSGRHPRTAADAKKSAAISREVAADPELRAVSAQRKVLAAIKAEAEAQLMARLGDIALNSVNEFAAVSAIDKALDRIVGKAVQPNVNFDGNALTPEQRRAEIDRLLAKRTIEHDAAD